MSICQSPEASETVISKLGHLVHETSLWEDTYLCIESTRLDTLLAALGPRNTPQTQGKPVVSRVRSRNEVGAPE